MVQFIKPLIDQLTQYCCCLIPDKFMFIIVLKYNYPTNKKNREGWHPVVGVLIPKHYCAICIIVYFFQII